MIYLLQVSLCWVLFYGVYAVFLRKETFFATNRVFLLASLALGLVIPVIGQYLPANGTSTEVYAAMTDIVLIQPQTMPQKSTPFLDPYHILLCTYAVGVVVSLTRLLWGIYKIWSIYQRGEASSEGSYVIVRTAVPHLPFSFFRYIFISNKVALSARVNTIIEHEQLHVSQWHSVDIVATELLHCFFWFNPILILYKQALKQSHEYLADAYVAAQSGKYSYGQLLLGQSTSGLEIALANHFFNSQIKNRIKMMYKEKSSNWSAIKYTAIIPLVVIACLVFSSHASESAPKATIKEKVDNYFSSAVSFESVEVAGLYSSLRGDHPDLEDYIRTEIHKHSPYKGIDFTVSSNGDEGSCIHTSSVEHSSDLAPTLVAAVADSNRAIYKVVEEMPRFPGCEHEQDKSARHDCARNTLLTHLYSNIKYPQAARDQGMEGMVVLQFVVNADGSISDETILRDVDGGCGAEALRVVQTFPTWIPGRQNGKAVAVQYTLPVKFKLADDNGENLAETEIPIDDVDATALYPGTTTKDASNRALLTQVYTSITYPAIARENGVEGMVVSQFQISSTGYVSDPKIVRSLGSGTDEQVLKVINEIAEAGPWTPAVKDGKNVAMVYTLPVKFKLEDDDSTEEAAAEVTITDLKAYPNPSQGQFTISFQSASDDPITIQVINVDGRQLQLFENVSIVGDAVFDVDVSTTEANGLLSVVVQQNNKQHSTKVLLQK